MKTQYKNNPLPHLFPLYVTWLINSRLSIVFFMCIVALGCDTVENIGYWSREESDDANTDRETGEPEETDTVDSESDNSDTNDTEDTGDSGDSDDSETIDTTEDTDTDTGTGTDTDTDTDTQYDIVPFSPSMEVMYPPIYPIPGTDNQLGLPGVWYKFLDNLNTGSYINVSLDFASDRFCAQGQVAQWTGSTFNDFTFAGLGAWLCSDYTVPSGEKYSMENCPYIETIRLDFKGVSFHLEGNVVPEMIMLRIFLTGGGWTSLPFVDVPVMDSQTEYMFSDMSDVTPSRISAIQILIPGSYNQAIPYDFCIRDFALLVTTD
ncbi:MAG: hypothetical protein JXR76_23250 [Deltaproteobacteria bacterium]|nr:hypothetical protein [Deltaproteobacteria bacterium]